MNKQKFELVKQLLIGSRFYASGLDYFLSTESYDWSGKKYFRIVCSPCAPMVHFSTGHITFFVHVCAAVGCCIRLEVRNGDCVVVFE